MRQRRQLDVGEARSASGAVGEGPGRSPLRLDRQDEMDKSGERRVVLSILRVKKYQLMKCRQSTMQPRAHRSGNPMTYAPSCTSKVSILVPEEKIYIVECLWALDVLVAMYDATTHRVCPVLFRRWELDPFARFD